MVSLIPRRSSFAVSGTPARAQVSDLIHVLKYVLCHNPWCCGSMWSSDSFVSVRLQILPEFGWGYASLAMFMSFWHYFTEFLSGQYLSLRIIGECPWWRSITRTIKTSVQDELTIPKQTRYLVPIELGRLERHVSYSRRSFIWYMLTRLSCLCQIYAQNFEQALLNLGLDARGVAATEDWEANTGLLRTWLRKLRGICTHPQVGQLQNQVDKLHRPGVLKTMGEVLEVSSSHHEVCVTSHKPAGHARANLAQYNGWP